MTTWNTYIAKHPVMAYYILAFAISWGGMLLVIGGPGRIPAPPAELPHLMPYVVLALMAGPSAACLLLTAHLTGRAGLRELGLSLLRWRVAARWYALALLSAPLLTTGVLLLFSLRSPQFLPRIVTAHNKLSLILLSVLALPFGGLLEELGWTGFAIPRLQSRYSVIGTGLVVGVLWGFWHFPVNIWYSSGISGGLNLTLFATLYFLTGTAQLTAYRILMVWVYDRTQSLLIATLMHGSLIVSTIPMFTPSTTGTAFLSWFAALTSLFWVAVATVVITNHRRFLRPGQQ